MYENEAESALLLVGMPVYIEHASLYCQESGDRTAVVLSDEYFHT